MRRRAERGRIRTSSDRRAQRNRLAGRGSRGPPGSRGGPWMPAGLPLPPLRLPPLPRGTPGRAGRPIRTTTLIANPPSSIHKIITFSNTGPPRCSRYSDQILPRAGPRQKWSRVRFSANSREAGSILAQSVGKGNGSPRNALTGAAAVPRWPPAGCRPVPPARLRPAGADAPIQTVDGRY